MDNTQTNKFPCTNPKRLHKIQHVPNAIFGIKSKDYLSPIYEAGHRQDHEQDWSEIGNEVD